MITATSRLILTTIYLIFGPSTPINCFFRCRIYRTDRWWWRRFLGVRFPPIVAGLGVGRKVVHDARNNQHVVTNSQFKNFYNFRELVNFNTYLDIGFGTFSLLFSSWFLYSLARDWDGWRHTDKDSKMSFLKVGPKTNVRNTFHT